MEDQNKDSSLINNVNNGVITKNKSRKEKLKKPLIIIVLILIIISAVFVSVNFMAMPYDRTKRTHVTFEVQEGEKLYDIAQKLEKKEIVDNASVFSFLAKIMMNSKFKPGVYFLSPSMDSIEIANILSNGITHTDGFTIPEGYTVEQLAKSLGQSGFIDEKKFLKAASSSDFSYFHFIKNSKGLQGTEKIEGFLLPDHYKVIDEADEVMLITAMLNQFDVFYNDYYIAREEELNLTTREVVVIASIIEKNTSNKKEKPKISAVIHNRRNIGIDEPLPTVPLCSPGKDSIKAALYPEENEYLYYVLSDKLDGTHVFTSSLSEYQNLKELYEKARDERQTLKENKKEPQ